MDFNGRSAMKKTNYKLILLLLLSAVLLTTNLIQLSTNKSNDRIMDRLDRNLLSELDGLRLELERRPTPTVLAVEQASKIAVLSTYTTLEFDYGYILETRIHEKFVHNEPFKDMDQIQKVILALQKDPSNEQLQHQLDLLLIK